MGTNSYIQNFKHFGVPDKVDVLMKMDDEEFKKYLVVGGSQTKELWDEAKDYPKQYKKLSARMKELGIPETHITKKMSIPGLSVGIPGLPKGNKIPGL